MYCFYNADLNFTIEQKMAYIKLLLYLAKADSHPDVIERQFIKKVMHRFNLPAEVLVNLHVPQILDDLVAVVQPIKGKGMVIDLLHTLRFAASIDGEIAAEEVKIIHSIANLLGIDDDTLLVINNFVFDEMVFLGQAQNVLEAEDVRC